MLAKLSRALYSLLNSRVCHLKSTSYSSSAFELVAMLNDCEATVASSWNTGKLILAHRSHIRWLAKWVILAFKECIGRLRIRRQKIVIIQQVKLRYREKSKVVVRLTFWRCAPLWRHPRRLDDLQALPTVYLSYQLRAEEKNKKYIKAAHLARNISVTPGGFILLQYA